MDGTGKAIDRGYIESEKMASIDQADTPTQVFIHLQDA